MKLFPERSDLKLLPQRFTDQTYMYRSPVVFLDRWYPRFRNFNSVFPIDVIRGLNSVSGSTLGAAFLVLMSFCTKEEG